MPIDMLIHDKRLTGNPPAIRQYLLGRRIGTGNPHYGMDCHSRRRSGRHTKAFDHVPWIRVGGYSPGRLGPTVGQGGSQLRHSPIFRSFARQGAHDHRVCVQGRRYRPTPRTKRDDFVAADRLLRQLLCGGRRQQSGVYVWRFQSHRLWQMGRNGLLNRAQWKPAGHRS
jgi:hypothetical protein